MGNGNGEHPMQSKEPHQRAAGNRRHPTKGQWATYQGPRGALGFWGLEKICVKTFPGRVWGKLAYPKGSQVPYKPFPSQKILGTPVGDLFLHKVMFFGPLWASKAFTKICMFGWNLW